MTPLAQRVFRELTLPKKDRTFLDAGRVLEKLDDLHCFDLRPAEDLVRDLSVRILDLGATAGVMASEKFAFLPAPRTWVERSVRWGRLAHLIERKGGGCLWTTIVETNGAFSSALVGYRPLSEDLVQFGANALMFTHERLADKAADAEWLRILACLALINSPRAIGRRTFQPHAGLQRALARSMGMAGKFPLNAWTEIKLEVAPREAGPGEPRPAYLSGMAALHFVRAHLRLVNGVLYPVRDHWRGDPALGIKRSRYVVVPPSASQAA